jgi:hypothetical protein
MLLSPTLIIPMTSQSQGLGSWKLELSSSSKAANSNCNSQQQQQSLEDIEKRRNKNLPRLACLLAGCSELKRDSQTNAHGRRRGQDRGPCVVSSHGSLVAEA